MEELDYLVMQERLETLVKTLDIPINLQSYFNYSVLGAPGLMGAPGDDGAYGDKGELGAIGTTGFAGRRGQMGKFGFKGISGDKGLPGNAITLFVFAAILRQNNL